MVDVFNILYKKVDIVRIINYLYIKETIMEDKNAFLQFEQIGRNRAKNEMDESPTPINYHFTELENPIDLFLTALTNQRTYAVEIKNRTFGIKRFPDFILETHKYRDLMAAWENSGYTPIYLMYFDDGRIAWDVRKIGNAKDRLQQMTTSVTTAVNYRKNMKDKDVILLKPSEGKVKYYT